MSPGVLDCPYILDLSTKFPCPGATISTDLICSAAEVSDGRTCTPPHSRFLA